MLFFHEATIEGVAIHKVGNKANDEFYILSENALAIDPEDHMHLMDFFRRPFSKIDQVFNLYHPNGIDLNIVDNTVHAFFGGNISLIECSQYLARHLYDVSEHPKIKGGEFFVVRFKDVVFEGECRRALGLFKSDNREMYLKVNTGGSVVMEFIEAINTQQLDKGALIIESDTDEGYEVVLSTLKNSTDLIFWKDDFLQLKARNDSYHQTATILRAAKAFITEKLDDTYELESVDKVDLLNQTIKYMKEQEIFEHEEYVHTVFNNPALQNRWTSFACSFFEGFSVHMPLAINISQKAVKKAQNSFKTVIKLDKNAHIYLHGNREILERGYDESKGMSYYKVYFVNEG